MRKRLLVLILGLVWLFSANIFAQQAPEQSEKIMDNSFFVEEAYNQEKGVIQHVNAFMLSRNKNWLYTFSEEMPIKSLKHQFSFSIPVQNLSGSARNIGDISVDYRYQLLGDGESTWAIAPRFTVVLPTGDVKTGLGLGAIGLQCNLPMSVEISKKIVTHWNAGITYTKSAQNQNGKKASLVDYNLGQSVIWLAKPNFNFVFETVWNRSGEVIGNNLTSNNSNLFINPGVRWAFNFKNGLQIVPGVSVPIKMGKSNGESGVFFYLSFEHPFKLLGKN